METRTTFSDGAGPTALEAVRFQSEDAAVEAPWTLGKPLGWASDDELMALLDHALEEERPGAGPSA
jgi:hypothetical protein